MAPLEDDDDPERGVRIATARAQANLTREQVAERLGHRRLKRTADDIERWEQGAPVTMRELQGLAFVLGESARYFAEGAEDTGVRVARRRAVVGLSQAELAEALDVDARNVQYWETGRNIMRKHVAQLARTLQTTPEYLLFGGEAVPASSDAEHPANGDADDRRQPGGMRGDFHEVSKRIAELRGDDDEASLTSLRADVRTLRDQVRDLVAAVRALQRQSRAQGRSDKGDSQREDRHGQ